MAQQALLAKGAKFRRVNVLKNKPLGVGSYGSVYKAKCDGTLCAAKIIHPTLVSTDTTVRSEHRHRRPMDRFMKECELLGVLEHPNIIRFLGMTTDRDTNLPVLLMELLDGNLTDFLKGSTARLPYNVEVALASDVISAISFLHSKKIIHRDLSSNNILISGNGTQAKLTDFGMAKLLDETLSRVSNTLCPGTTVFMPPEALATKGGFTKRGDIFSFGVVTIQILTRKFPDPTEQFETQMIGCRRQRVCISEVERRRNHIDEVDTNHPLLSIAKDCLMDYEDERPPTDSVFEKVVALRKAKLHSIDSTAKAQVLQSTTVSRSASTVIDSRKSKVRDSFTTFHDYQSLTPQGGWTCPRCSMYNDKDNINCVTCIEGRNPSESDTTSQLFREQKRYITAQQSVKKRFGGRVGEFFTGWTCPVCDTNVRILAFRCPTCEFAYGDSEAEKPRKVEADSKLTLSESSAMNETANRHRLTESLVLVSNDDTSAFTCTTRVDPDEELEVERLQDLNLNRRSPVRTQNGAAAKTHRSPAPSIDSGTCTVSDTTSHRGTSFQSFQENNSTQRNGSLPVQVPKYPYDQDQTQSWICQLCGTYNRVTPVKQKCFVCNIGEYAPEVTS